jgi:pilus assembly protein CpaF
MGFFFSVPPTPVDSAKPAALLLESAAEKIIHEVRMQKPMLLDAKLELHARIIDEFNLVSLDKLSRTELFEEIRSYVATYARTAKLALNQKELQAFPEEVVDEMKGFGPIEPLL